MHPRGLIIGIGHVIGHVIMIIVGHDHVVVMCSHVVILGHMDVC